MAAVALGFASGLALAFAARFGFSEAGTLDLRAKAAQAYWGEGKPEAKGDCKVKLNNDNNNNNETH